MNKISLSALNWAPPFAHGLVRDIRVRWALREAGQHYEIDLIDFKDRRGPTFMARQPFGQVPVLTRDGIEIFETGAILYAIGLEHEALLPPDPEGRLDTLTWMFAALNTIEPPIMTLSTGDRGNPEPEWRETFRPRVVEIVSDRLANLDRWLAGRTYLTGRFSAADILMTTALRFGRQSGVLEAFAEVEAYRARCEARPAFKAALDEQIRDFSQSAGPA